MKIAIQTLGCKVNQSESSSMEGILRDNDYEIVRHDDNPDICIVNTCTVTAKSDYQSRQLIRKAIRSGAKVVATGCYAQLRSEDLRKIEGLNSIIGNSGKHTILSHVQNISTQERASSIEVHEPSDPLSYKPYASSRSRAFLKIQDGCNFSCSYCTVPMARGKSRSLDTASVLRSVNNLVSSGYKEIVLTGIHIGAYGTDLKPESSLLEIVKSIIDSCTDVRIRLSSIEPREFKPEFLEYMKKGRVCRHLHIPLQSGCDNILKKMNRGYSSEYYKQVIHSIVTDYPEISLGTDIIVGFPGETDNDFDSTVRFIKSLPLSYLHAFPYSARPNTRATGLNEHVSKATKKIRVKKLLNLSRKLKYEYNTRYIKTILNVIIEGKSSKSRYYNALSDNYLKILVNSESLEPGQCIPVRVISLTDKGLVAEPL